MQRFSHAVLAAVTASMVAIDIWIAAMRCSSSPPIDWSRLAFGLTMQLALVVGGVVLVRTRGRLGRSGLTFSMGLLVAVAVSFALVRQPLLLSDTTLHKFHASGSNMCPGVPDSWKHGE